MDEATLTETAEPAAAGAKLEIAASRQFGSWLHEQRISLAFTTYQAGKLFLVGHQTSEQLSMFERNFSRCMGLHVDGDRLWMSTLYQLWRFENALDPGVLHKGYDRVYVPRLGYTTGDIDTHDIAVDSEGRVVFVNTLFSCLATLSEQASFVPLWRPPFISKLAAEDRCHLNGLAMRDGKPAYVTAVSRSDVAAGWRDHRRDGGVVIDVASGAVVAEGFAMPHSPRVYEGRLWLLESGTGYFGYVDLASRRFERLTFCPGYLRGLAFFGDFALVGLSRCRENRSLSGLPLDDELAKRHAEPRCGLMVIDLRTADIVHWLSIEGPIQELYDVAVIPNVVRPMAIGFKTDEIRRIITIGKPAS
ncbi:TIGR03032 family protein [Defluviicoccus vanus]|uniref:TIGR03032 family protein n=1 Tax=Defluviicoccus vanus TaxID=111831 RepID=A0A7H1N3Z8_9PROT|nr:TIGR03032 family protein [Defluviicoccus vanus]QNT70434.1 TIGR03032 family protein [Defluviicoccus vanus]